MSEPEGSAARGASVFRLARVIPWVGLALVATALAAGVPAARVRVLAAELALAALATTYFAVAGRATQRRARRQRTMAVPWGVRLDEPLWLRMHESCIPLALGGLLSALPAALGWPAFSVGVLLTALLIGVGLPLFSGSLTPSALTFHDAELEVHFSGVSVAIPWGDITHLETVGPDHFALISLHLANPTAIVASAKPSTAAGRRRAETALGRQGAGAVLMLMPWTAGLDGPVLVRAIEAGRSGRAGPSALN